MNFVVQNMSKMAFHPPQSVEQHQQLDFFANKPTDSKNGATAGNSRPQKLAPTNGASTNGAPTNGADHHGTIDSVPVPSQSFPLEPQAQVPSQTLPPQFSLPYHNPFDFNSYPITNPPIFDSTMMVPYTSSDGVPRRRRLSISNGQIGQITNHEAFMEPRNDFDARYPLGRPGSTGPGEKPDLHADLQSTPEDGPTPISAAGVPPPNHQLIYNNEVIYNPNDGPIPGTAAWKRERLLERNRVAASKCRQRKKQAQQQLQDSISKYEKLLETSNRTVQRYETLVGRFKAVIRETIDKNGADLSGLRMLLDASINDIE